MVFAKVQATWSGSGIGTGLSTFAFSGGPEPSVGEASQLLVAVRDFFAGLASTIPGTVTVSFPTLVELIDETNGLLVGELNAASPGAPISGSGSGQHAGGVGARVRWRTNSIRNGRRVVGTTFIVPIVSGAYEPDGTIGSANLLAMSDAGTQLLADANAATHPLCVWSRPSQDPLMAGMLSLVTSAYVPDQASWLRTRR